MSGDARCIAIRGDRVLRSQESQEDETREKLMLGRTGKALHIGWTSTTHRSLKMT